MSLTDRISYPVPPLPFLGPAGFNYQDSVFGSDIGRVTDGAFASDLGLTNHSFVTPSASYQQAWSADGTKFFVLSDDGSSHLVGFNRFSMARGRIGATALPFSREPLCWDPADPNILYGTGYYVNHHTIVKVNTSSLPWTVTLLLDLDTIMPGLGDSYIGALNVVNGNLFCTFGGYNQDQHRFALMYPLANPAGMKLLDTMTRNGMDEVNSHFTMHSAQPDRSGRFYNMRRTDALEINNPLAKYATYIWDSQSNLVYPCTSFNGGHEAMGWNARINTDVMGDYDAAQWILTPDMLAPNSNRIDLISPVMEPREIYLADHPSWNNATAGTRRPFYTATYRVYDGPNNVPPNKNEVPHRAWDDEILGITTTASGASVERFGFHRSLVYPEFGVYPDDFYYTPRFNVDCQGQFGIYTTNWEKNLGINPVIGNFRTDVMVIRLGTGVVPLPDPLPTVGDFRVKMPHSNRDWARYNRVR